MQAQELLGKTVTIRNIPSSTGLAVGSVLPRTTVEAVGVVNDRDHPLDENYKWLDLGNSRYVNYIYPPNGLRFSLLPDTQPQPSASPSAPPTEPYITHSIVVYSDGSIELDGIRYK